MESKLVVFNDKQIRRTLHNNEWWFSVADVIEALTESVNVKDYIKKMRKCDMDLNSNWGTICTPVELRAPGSKLRKTNCANTEPESKKRQKGKVQIPPGPPLSKGGKK